MTAETLGAYIDERRKELKLSKVELAKKAGEMSRQNLYKILNGDSNKTLPSLLTVIHLANALKVHPLILVQKLFDRYDFSAITTEGAHEIDDGIGFVGDITYPDNTMVKPGEEFTKIWRLQNIGKKIWKNRVLKCLDDQLDIPDPKDKPEQKTDITIHDRRRGLTPEFQHYLLPIVEPGDTIDIKIKFTAPQYPGSMISYWKMYDAHDNLCYPELEGITCLVNAGHPESEDITCSVKVFRM